MLLQAGNDPEITVAGFFDVLLIGIRLSHNTNGNKGLR